MREQWQNELQKLQEVNLSLSSTQVELKTELQKATDEIQQRDRTIDSLRCELSVLKNRLGEASSSDMKKQLQEAEEYMKKTDEELKSLKHFCQSEQKEMEELRASLQESKTSGRLERSEESWKLEISQLKELLAEKEQHISRVEAKRFKRSLAHMDTLALLTSTQTALKQQAEKYALLEAGFLKKLADQRQSFQQELQSREESFRKELSQAMKRSDQELSDMRHQWEAKQESWSRRQMELEEVLQKNNMWGQEVASHMEKIQRLKGEVVQLQVSCHHDSSTCSSLHSQDFRWLNLKYAVFLDEAEQQREGEQNQERQKEEREEQVLL